MPYFKKKVTAEATFDKFIKQLRLEELDTFGDLPRDGCDEDIVPDKQMDDRLYTETEEADEEEIVPAEEVPSGRQYTF